MSNDNLNEILLKASIHYYCLNGMYRSMQSSATEGMRTYPSEQSYRFYYGISLAFEGRIQESIRELDLLVGHKDLMLASFLALIYAHRKCQVVDKEAVNQFEAKLREVRKTASENSLYFAGLFLLLSNRLDKSREYIDRMIQKSPSFDEGLILKGWLEVLSSKSNKENSNSAMKYFDISTKKNDPDVILGKIKVYEMLSSFMTGLEQLNKAIFLYPKFLPVFIEKMKFHAALKDWEQAIDAASRCLSIDKHCIEAQRYLILHKLAWDSNENQATSMIPNLFSSIEVREPKNAKLYFESGKLFARLADNNQNVLTNSLSFIERTVFLDPTNTEYICEQAYQCLLLNRMTEAMRYYKSASKMDEKSINSLIGLLQCKLLNDEKDVDEQIDSLEEFHRETGMSIELLYLLTLYEQKRNNSFTKIQNYLDKIINIQLEIINEYPLGVSYYINLQPNFIISIAKMYLMYLPNESLTHGQAIPPALKQINDLLNPLVNSCPSMKEPLYLMSIVKYLSNDNLAAISLMNKCLEGNQSFSDGHLLMARIYESQKKYQTANKSLEIALSHNFQIRDQVQYILTKSSVLKSERKYDEALKLLKSALDKDKTLKKSKINKNDKISLYLQIVDIYSVLGQISESTKLLNELLQECKGTLDEGRVLIASAQLAMARGETEQALNGLKEITNENNEHFIRSRELMATIYLKNKKDRRLYASCYKEILDKIPLTQSYLMLGDAYMNILEPERAIEIYEQALKKNPKDWVLTRKVGQALIQTHFYEKAVTYYKAAIKTSGQNTFRYDLAHLLFRMKRYEESEEIINNALQILINENTNDINNLEWQCKMIHLLAQIQLNTDKKKFAIDTLRNAHNTNQKLMRRIPVEQPDLLEEHKTLSINVCIQLAELISTYLRDQKQAAQIYKEALNYDNSDVNVLMALAKLETLNNNFDLAHSYCTVVLKHAPEMTEPVMMMADLTFRQNDFESALIHFEELLNRKPTYYTAMARYIEIIRRIGKLEIVSVIFEKAEKHSPRTSIDPGYHYCKGLANWYTGNTNEAMKCFNKTRKDSEFGVIATYHMIEICINHDNQLAEGEAFDEFNSNLSPNSYENSIKLAQNLLEEIRPKVKDDLDFQLMSNFVLLAKRLKNECEFTLSEFVKILSDDRYKDNVGAVLGAATASMILKQTPKARNQLKRVAKSPWNFSDAEYLERSWLLLADIYIQTGKYDMATELLKRCLQYNKSCMKAYEYFGFIMEKEQSYKDAVQNYEVAWKLCNKNNPVVGFKLAFNYMKAKRHVNAIDVSKEILMKFPEYPKVRKDIMDKCKQFLKS